MEATLSSFLACPRMSAQSCNFSFATFSADSVSGESERCTERCHECPTLLAGSAKFAYV